MWYVPYYSNYTVITTLFESHFPIIEYSTPQSLDNSQVALPVLMLSSA